MQVVDALLDPLDCVEVEGSAGSEAGEWSVGAGYYVESSLPSIAHGGSSEPVACFTVQHLAISTLCVVALLLYGALVLRLLRVRGTLSAIEFQLARPWRVSEVRSPPHLT